MNKLWLLRPADNYSGPWDPWYDKAFGFVVRARSSDEARKIVAYSLKVGDEGKEAWLVDMWSSCTELTADGPVEIVMVDFHSA